MVSELHTPNCTPLTALHRQATGLGFRAQNCLLGPYAASHYALQHPASHCSHYALHGCRHFPSCLCRCRCLLQMCARLMRNDVCLPQPDLVAAAATRKAMQ